MDMDIDMDRKFHIHRKPVDDCEGYPGLECCIRKLGFLGFKNV